MKRTRILNSAIVLILSLVFVVGMGGGSFAYGGSAIDNSDPEIKSFHILDAGEIDIQGEISAGITVEDAGSGAYWILASFREKGSTETDSWVIEFYNDRSDPINERTDVFTVPVPSSNFNEGEYELVDLYVEDIDGNYSLYEGNALAEICDTRTVTFVNDISGRDNVAPVINSISIENAEAVKGKIKFIIDLDEAEEPDGTGVAWMSFRIKDEEGNEQAIDVNSWDLINGEPLIFYPHSGVHAIEVPVGNRLPNGRYVIDSIYIVDDANNETEYLSGKGPLAPPVAFTVVKSTKDTVPPLINSISFKEDSLTLPNVWNVALDVTENESGIYGMTLEMMDEDYNRFELNYNTDPGDRWKSGKTYNLAIPVGPFFRNGTYKLTGIRIWDESNATQYAGENSVRDYPLEDINAGDIHLTLKSAFDIASYGSVEEILSAVSALGEGSGEVLLLDSRSKKIIPKRVFEAIAGKNIILVCQDNDVQWVFDGNLIELNKCKDVDISTNIHVEEGASINPALEGRVLVIDFANNGVLPGKTEVRINHAYISAKYAGGENQLVLSYINGGEIDTEDGSVRIDGDEAAVLSITHNSRFTLSSQVSIARATVDVSNCIYSGSWQKPSVTVRLKGRALASKCYSIVRWTDNKGVGTGYVTVEGNKRFGYKGQASGHFYINPKKAAISKVTVGKKQMTVKMKSKPSALGASSYKIEYRVAGKGKWKSTKTSSKTKTIKKLKKGKKYQVRVTAVKGARKGAVSAVKKSGKIK